jgi:hypothetical protein
MFIYQKVYPVSRFTKIASCRPLEKQQGHSHPLNAVLGLIAEAVNPEQENVKTTSDKEHTNVTCGK